jgi:hypothetical protein
MRINGFEQIKAFYSWVFNNSDKVRPTHISLYLFLWNQGNRANWVEWFKCPYDLAMQGACIGNKGTYYRCLDDLQNFGLIKYTKGENLYKAPLINLLKLYESVPLSEQVTVPLSEPQGVPQTEPLSVLLSGNIYKLITDNHKRVSDNLEKWLALDSENEFKFPVGNNLNKPKDENELRDLIKTKSQNVGLTPLMVEALKDEIVNHYAQPDKIWRRADQQPILNWRQQIGTTYLTDLKILEFKNKYLKQHPEQMLASNPKTRNN